MAQVNVTISGKTYRMACEDGQEDHLAGMADAAQPVDRAVCASASARSATSG